jgi:hypothetical protein
MQRHLADRPGLSCDSTIDLEFPMNIKSIMLGSAAAFLAVSGARAADAVVMVEPEPAEYVRVCDAYGTGFFYIPGTETCLKVGGYLRFRLQANDQETNTDADGIDGYTAGMRLRARLDFDAREETELGTLRGKVRLEATNTFSSTAGYTMEEGYIQLGGLIIGHLDSMWTNDDGGVEDGLLVDEADFAAGDITTNRISYTYASNGFSASASLEDDGDGDFVPDVIGKLVYQGGWGAAYVLGAYDEDAAHLGNSRLGVDPSDLRTVYLLSEDGFGGGEDAFVFKGGLLLKNLVIADSEIKVEGHYATDPSVYAQVGDVGGYSTADDNDFDQPAIGAVNGGGMNFSSQWQIGAALSQEFGKFFVVGNAVYGRTFDLSARSPGFDYGNVGEIDYYGLATDVGYKLTKNFTVKGELSYVDLDLPAGIDDYDQTRGFLEFRREF